MPRAPVDKVIFDVKDRAMQRIILIGHNIRSCHNVGSLLRTADGFGIEKMYMTGYTPYPMTDHDNRLPHIARRINAQIHKTALDAETFIPWEHMDELMPLIKHLRNEGFQIIALEQSSKTMMLPNFVPRSPVAIIVGREVEGIESEVLSACDIILEIPMMGKKESFNVAIAGAVALYHISQF